MPDIHEIQVGDATIEPQGGLAVHKFIRIARFEINLEISKMHLVGSNTEKSANGERLRGDVGRRVWQGGADKSSAPDFDWGCLRPACIGKDKSRNSAVFGAGAIVNLARSVSESIRDNVNYREFESNCCSSAEVGGVSGNASSFVRPPQVVKLAERYSAESESNYRQGEGEKGDGVGSRPLPKGFAFFIFMSGLSSFLVTTLLLVLWERVR